MFSIVLEFVTRLIGLVTSLIVLWYGIVVWSVHSPVIVWLISIVSVCGRFGDSWVNVLSK